MSVDSRFILSGYGFDERGPHLVLDAVPEARRRRSKLHLLSRVLTIKALDERFCVGRYDLETMESTPCPHQAEVPASFTMCTSCRSASGFNPAFYNASQDQMSPQQRRYNLNPHVVYLAAFGSGVTKVGIASTERVMTRLLEQGARIATIICACDNAYEARNIEEAVARTARIPEAIKSSDKRRLLSQRIDLDIARGDLEAAKSRVRTSLGLELLDNELLDLSEKYCGSHELRPYAVDLSDQVPMMISGTAIALVGDTLVVGAEGKQFMLSMKKCLAHVVSLEFSETKNLYTPVAMQTSLF